MSIVKKKVGKPFITQHLQLLKHIYKIYTIIMEYINKNKYYTYFKTSTVD